MPQGLQENRLFKLLAGLERGIQLKDSVPFLRNAAFSSEYDSVGGITNERGFLPHPEPSSWFFTWELYVGHVILDKGHALFFTTNDVSAPKRQRILLYNGIDLEVLGDRSDFGFSINNQISGIFKYNKVGERVVYFLDGLNDYRFINVDNPITISSTDDIAVDGGYVQIANITLEKVDDTGGILPSGMYCFAGSYSDSVGNETDIFEISPYIAITDDVSTVDFDQYDGCDAGTVTTKSIKLRAAPLDSDFAEINIYVIKVVGGQTTAQKIKTLSIEDEIVYFTYTGNEEAEDTDIRKILVPRIKYTTPRHIAQKDNVVYLAGLSMHREEGLQEAVNNIKCATIVSQFEPSIMHQNHKSPLEIFYRKCFAGDEVYGIGLVPIYKNGQEGVPYFISGREISTAPFGGAIDGNENTTILSSDARNPLGRDVPYWYLINTSRGGLWTGNPYIDANNHVLENGYYESTEEYPSGKGYPTGKIRLHKVSDDFLPVVKDRNGKDVLRGAGFRLKDIKIPKSVRDKIQGFKIVRTVREEHNRSIVAKGWMFPGRVLNTERPSEDNILKDYAYRNYLTVGFPFSVNHNLIGGVTKWDYPTFWSPDTNLVNPVIPVGYYIKSRAHLFGGTVVGEDINGNRDLTKLVATLSKNLYNNNLRDKFSKILGSQYVSPNIVADTPNLNMQGSFPYSSFQWNKFLNIFGKGTLALRLDDPTVTGVQWSDNCEPIDPVVDGSALYTYIKRDQQSQYGRIEDMVFVDTGTVVLDLTEADFDNNDNFIRSGGTLDVFGGDVFVGYWGFLKDAVHQGTLHRTCIESFLESPINVGLRHTNDAGQKYTPKTDPITLMKQIVLDNPSVYNFDYSANPVKKYRTEKDNAVFRTDFDNRIIHCVPDAGESQLDNYRRFLANDYVDLPSDKGKITDIFVRNNKLFARTEFSIYDTQAGYHKIETTENTLYVGTGEIFGLRPVPIFEGEPGVGGSESKWGAINSPVGNLYIDTGGKRVFLFDGNSAPKDISTEKIGTWLEENGHFKLLDELTDSLSFTPDYPRRDNIISPYGIGWLALYDVRNKRFLITKRDFGLTTLFKQKFQGQYVNGNPYVTGDIVYNNGSFYLFRTATVNFTKTDFPDKVTGLDALKMDFDSYTDYFEDEGFTLSYAYNRITGEYEWCGIHDYIPSAGLTLSNNKLLMRKNFRDGTENISIHSLGPYGRYFPTIDGALDTHSFVIEVVLNEGDFDKILTNIVVESRGYGLEDPNNSFLPPDKPDLFFDEMIVYNDYQLSGTITLVMDTNVIRSGRDYHINEFYNKVKDFGQPLFFKAGLDKTINNLAIDVTDWQEETRFKGKHITVRFISNNLQNKKILVSLIKLGYQPVYK